MPVPSAGKWVRYRPAASTNPEYEVLVQVGLVEDSQGRGGPNDPWLSFLLDYHQHAAEAEVSVRATGVRGQTTYSGETLAGLRVALCVLVFVPVLAALGYVINSGFVAMASLLLLATAATFIAKSAERAKLERRQTTNNN
jgi:hypothetical protein